MQSCRTPFWIYNGARLLTLNIDTWHFAGLTSTSSSSTRGEYCNEPGMDSCREDRTGSVANMSSFRVSSSGSTISKVQVMGVRQQYVIPVVVILT